ncbi:MAG: hypothetical protein ABJF50_09150 [Paracoccaceae bacterium]
MTPKRTMSFGSELKNCANEALSIAKGTMLPAGVLVCAAASVTNGMYRLLHPAGYNFIPIMI